MQLVQSLLARLVVVASDGETFVAVPLVHGPQPLPVDLESVLAPQWQRASVTAKSVDVYYSLSWLKVLQELDQELDQEQQQWPLVAVLAWLAAVQSFVHSLFCCEGARWFSAKKVRLWFSVLILFYQHTPYTRETSLATITMFELLSKKGPRMYVGQKARNRKRW
mmetsp:Transcript_29102/g.52651  ORF Transcript_29102/g.52651 Transcript_29102/m.52651 type:complete len:165 (+) Transcript_29102:973-1467(+)